MTQLKSYLGLLSYYGKFLPNLATHLAPLYELLGHKTPWKWTSAHDKAFQKSKKLLTSYQLLVHFDPELPITVACDASAYGLGVVLAHKMPDGSERPIGYASRTLNKAERNYSQLEKEGLSRVFGIKKFYSYLFGHKFELVTDHQPLLGLLGELKSASPQASARIRRWSLFLSNFEYTLKFRSTSAHANADALSRLPLAVEPTTEDTPPELVLLAEHLDESTVTAAQIRAWTRRDPQLALVVQFLQQGWPNSCNEHPDLAPFFSRRTELSLFDGCVLWGTRVVVPELGRRAVLAELHEGHPGMARMKGLSRMYVWWPGIAESIEESVRHCTECQLNQATPAPLHPWSWPTRPWARLHVDFAGLLKGKMFLILIDAHSKWIEAFHTPNATTSAVIEELRTVFAKFGLPETIVTDNGSCFTSEEFEQFLKKNGITHLTSAPYHNGLAERAVQIVKKGLKKITEGTLEARLAKILMSYRLTPQSTTGISPAELLLGRRPRSRLDLLKPHSAERVERNQQKQKEHHDIKARSRNLNVGENVFVRNYHRGSRWLPGRIERQMGPISFRVKLTNGQSRRCHQDQIRKRSVCVDIPDEDAELDIGSGSNLPAVEESISKDTVDTPVPPVAAPRSASSIPVPERKSYPK